MQALFFCFFLATTLAQHYCCTPESWEGYATIFDKKNDFRGIEAISYEFNPERPRLRTDLFIDELSQNRTVFLTEFQIGRPGNVVDVYTYTQGTCKKDTRGPLQRTCFRDNHRRVRHVVIGGRLFASVLLYADQNGEYEMIASHEHRGREREEPCIPVSGAIFSHQQDRYTFDAEIRFYDVRPGIGNGAIFELPESCRKL